MKLCSLEGCGGKHRSRGYCQRHYTQAAKGQPLVLNPKHQKRGPNCAAQGCWHPVTARGLCKAHYERKRGGRLDWSSPLKSRRTGWVLLRKSPTNDVGFMVPKVLMEKLERTAQNRGLDVHQVAVDILQVYFAHRQMEYTGRGRPRSDTWSKRDDDCTEAA
jgi:hypothetical protein